DSETAMSAGTRLAMIFAATFAAGAVSGGFLPLWFADRGMTPGEIGRILGIASLVRVFTGPGWGNVADRLGRRRPVLLVSAIVATAAALAYVPTTGFIAVLAVAVVLGIAGSALNPLVDSLALSLARDRQLDYGPVRAVGSVAYMLASAATGRLLTAFGSVLVPWLVALAYAAAALCVPLLPEAPARRAPPRRLAGLRLFALRPFRLTVAASALIQGSHAA